MSSRTRKTLLLLLAAALLAGLYPLQVSLNRDRDLLGLTRMQPLDNAPPVLAFTTVALGGFRGLISNALWIRATDLQDEDKFFEMAQLADWITKLEPHFIQVWLVQAWNMAYNISVKFKDYPDRWRWVQRGIELLRDQGLRFNPNEVMMYRELAWFFQHKLGQNLDDAGMYYKQQWANQMAVVFGKQAPNLDELIDPKTPEQVERARLLREKYKMDPKFMKVVDERHGPLEWRLPESHAIYWAAQGLERAKDSPRRVKQEELISLRRVIYQSMQLSALRGRLVANAFARQFEFGPNLEIIPKVNAAYEQAAQEDAANRDQILRAHRNFLRDAVYFLYQHNRISEAARWYKYLIVNFGQFPVLDYKQDSLPAKVPLDEYVVARVQTDVAETDPNRVKATIQGLLLNSYHNQAIGEDERAAGFKLMARQVWNVYQGKIGPDRTNAIGLPALKSLDDEVRTRMLSPETGFDPDERAVLREQLGLPKETPAAASSTNAPPAKVSGN
jgi:hypothetical protein